MVEYEQHGRVAVLTINRPEARNAVNGDVANGMEAAIDRLEDDDDTWVGIVAGDGPVFSAGADLKAIAAGKARRAADAAGRLRRHRAARAHQADHRRRRRPRPRRRLRDRAGVRPGRRVSTAAAFGIPEVKRSLVAAAGGLFRLPRALRPQRGHGGRRSPATPSPPQRAYELGHGQRAGGAGRGGARRPWRWPSASAPTRRWPCARRARSCGPRSQPTTTRCGT